MLEKYKKQDYRIQVMRILASMIVIGCHIRLDPIQADGVINKSILFLHGFMDDGVSIFFILTGFFLFHTKSFKKLGKKTIISIILPTLAIMFLSPLLASWVQGSQSFIECIKTFHFNFKEYIVNIVGWVPGNGNLCFHLWYIASYVEIIATFPVLRLLTVKENKTAKKALTWVVVLGLIGLIINDLTAVVSSFHVIKTFTIFSVPILLVLLGYIIYQNKDKFEGNKMLRVSTFLGAILVNVVRFILLYFLLQKDNNNTYFYFWSTGIACIFTVCFILFFLTFKDKKNKLTAILNYIGSRTFSIYLIHVLVYTKLDSLGIKRIIYNWFLNSNMNIFGVTAFTFIYILLIFIICLAISIVLSEFKNLIIKLYIIIKNRFIAKKEVT